MHFISYRDLSHNDGIATTTGRICTGFRDLLWLYMYPIMVVALVYYGSRFICYGSKYDLGKF